ncbi:hypothetical protein GSI_04072 [Ganoderma sinense ZZ0214-1]|uniref:Cyclin N-terminal domain-containing protein n=1 Tax=Ganoderma sinense ZZ0214-1 TaxID=1077348 RepID=A0A2G8SI52_9APHY|nr:hypothetical protein GSI_04072 [Ganoderma sinense ZZ0214-1]
MSHPAGSKAVGDPYYGHRDFAKLCARFITHLFESPDTPPTTGSPFDDPPIPLAKFVAYALHRSHTGESTVFAALYLLQRLKFYFPAAIGCDGMAGHRMFLPALRIASQSLAHVDYWVDVSGGIFHRDQVDGADRDLRRFLGNYVAIDPAALREFERRVRRDFAGRGPYPDYTKSQVHASASSEHGRPPAQRQGTSGPGGMIAVHSGGTLGPRTPGLSTSAEAAHVAGIPGMPTDAGKLAHSAGTKRMQRPPTVPQPGAIYARPQAYLW